MITPLLEILDLPLSHLFAIPILFDSRGEYNGYDKTSDSTKLDGKLRDKGARNLKAAKALLDVDALKASKNQDADIDAAIDALTKGADTAHEFNPQPTGQKANIGGPTGNTPSGKMTREQIAKIADRNERYQAIHANMNLFNK